MSALDVEVGDTVHYKKFRWRVTDVYERSPIRQPQASLNIIDAANDEHPVILTGVPVHELVLEWRLK